MFPVPAHLPRTVETIQPNHTAGPHFPHRNWSTESEQPPNNVLDLLQPLTQQDQLTLQVVVDVRKKLQDAVEVNKATTHHLVLENYPAISHHVRTSAEAHKQLKSISKEINQLERQVEIGGSTSLLPPLLAFLEEHSFNAKAQAKASARLRILQSVSERRNAVLELEKAIWSGQGADRNVLVHLMEASRMAASGTNVDKIISARVRGLKDLVTDQLISTFHRVISFSTEKGKGAVLTVTHSFCLERSQLSKSASAPRPLLKDSGSAPVIDMSLLFDALQTLGELDALLTSTLKLVLKSIVQSLLPVSAPNSQAWILEQSSSDKLSILRLVPSSPNPSSATQSLAELEKVYTFITSHFPAPTLHASLRTSLLDQTLESIIQSSIPDELPALPAWLQTTRETVAFEARISSSERPLQAFAETRAVLTWAQRRRMLVAEHVRGVIDGFGGWKGWDGKVLNRQTEITEFVEVEVDVAEPELPAMIGGQQTGEADDGWGFEADGSPTASTSRSIIAPGPTASSTADDMQIDDGWGFDESKAATPAAAEEPLEDGWDFDAAPTPVIAPKKPVREARKLGKLKAKVQKSSSPVPSLSPRGSFDDQPPQAEDDGWSNGWEEQSSPKKFKTEVLQPIKKTRIEVQERKRVVEEPLLVSVACDEVVQSARVVLHESVELRERVSTEDLSAPQATLRDSARDVFDLYRSLMPLTFGRQLRDVPSIAMQLYNDCSHLADQVGTLKLEFDSWAEASADLENRLRSFGMRSFQAQVMMQKESLAESLREAHGFVDTVDEAAFRKCERAIHQVTHKLESLDRVWRGVLAPSTRQEVMGELVDSAVSAMASSILSLADITELESNRIGELCKLMHPLDQLFVAPDSEKSNIVAVVPHWLKFCYVIELMQASLVDILYLFDTGALQDFETDEIINLIRALFAETQQRANAVDHVQGGRPESS